MGRPQTEHTARNVIARALKNVGTAVTAAGSPSLTPEYLTKLRTTCLRLAAANQPNGKPDEVVREAERRYRDCLSFLTGAQS